uniref:Uncharacterized protein n=1 Tax=Tanacetum cinerariifolium TaxID=118510 RepID=A0A699JGK0_TANCI|nr:hypothetical protein [Tanacetum cinerariifolium]
MPNPLPPGHTVDLFEDEPVHLIPAPVILDHAPLHPKGYLSDIEEEDSRVENKELREMLKTAQERAKYYPESDEYYHCHLARISWHYHQLSHWDFEIEWHLPQGMHYQEIPYDLATDPTMRTRSDDPYVMA